MDFKIPEPKVDLTDIAHQYKDVMEIYPLENYLNSMELWWPLIKHTDVPKPHTQLASLPLYAVWMLIDSKSNIIDKKDLEEKLYRMFQFYVQNEKDFFIRGYYHSAKHERGNFKLNHLTTKEEFLHEYKTLLNATLMKDLPIGGLAFREYIELESYYNAFNGLPIAKEIRWLVHKNGNDCVAYWPASAIKFMDSPMVENYQELHKKIAINKEEEQITQKYALKLYDALKIKHDYWSFDFAKGKDGIWYFIDCADGWASWKPEGFREKEQAWEKGEIHA